MIWCGYKHLHKSKFKKLFTDVIPKLYESLFFSIVLMQL